MLAEEYRAPAVRSRTARPDCAPNPKKVGGNPKYAAAETGTAPGSGRFVPAPSTLLAALVGGALRGLAGALVAIPVAAALHLIAQEVLFPRLDKA
ncbi:hypothetical protein AB0H42_23580 [Nocardia sp. NPDC050799]|uniref:hypothetical protein n=1 Tax=Nocardia sp. NPDC050799 TaxID=3154842 RepID=UPI0034101C8E